MKSKSNEHQKNNSKMVSKHLFIAIISVLIFSSCGNKKTENEAEAKPTSENTTTLTDAQIKNAGVQTGKIEQREISTTLKLNGKIDVPPQNLVSISVPMGG
ncbi:hypothetical protein [Flavobacterium sp. ACAM 123]|uniref:hypothetical protein n=1 Tax=Flavobacterium sp. ACAM 123 TaxID=1189620 RepID=UPI00030037E5|nr:hypothetical protein [Flavobacterium sp. ACAM 123]